MGGGRRGIPKAENMSKKIMEGGGGGWLEFQETSENISKIYRVNPKKSQPMHS